MEEIRLNPLTSGKQLAQKKYHEPELAPEWVAILGPVESNFRAFVHGNSGHGKSTLVMKLCKHYVSQLGHKVYYNSVEQGTSKSMQDMANREGLATESLFQLAEDRFEHMVKRLTKKGYCPKLIVVDSCEKMGITADQYEQLLQVLKHRRNYRPAFIFIGRGSNPEKPDSAHAKYIQYDASVKVFVKDGVATSRSRYGDTKPFVIWEKKKTGHQLSLIPD